MSYDDYLLKLATDHQEQLSGDDRVVTRSEVWDDIASKLPNIFERAVIDYCKARYSNSWHIDVDDIMNNSLVELWKSFEEDRNVNVSEKNYYQQVNSDFLNRLEEIIYESMLEKWPEEDLQYEQIKDMYTQHE
jgi:hypothetical protein